MVSLANAMAGSPNAPKLMAGTGRDQVHLLIAVTGDRGLAGAFNANVGRLTRNLVRKLQGEGKTVKILAVGRKGRDYLRRDFPDSIVADFTYAGRKSIGFADASAIAEKVMGMLAAGEFDICTVIYNRFVSGDDAGAERDAADPGAEARATGRGQAGRACGV